MSTSWIDALENAVLDVEANRATTNSVLQKHQKPPEGNWTGWVMLAGRGTGKTFAGMRWLNERCMQEPGLRARVIAPTLGDGVASCVEGPDGLLVASNFKASWNASAPGGSVVSYPNGSKVWIIGTPGPKDVDRLRALTNIEIDVFEEAFANSRLAEAWDQADLSRRRGKPRVVITSTPRPHALIKQWEADPDFVITRAITADNKFLDPNWVKKLEKKYAGTRLYRQEVLGEVVEDVEGALWTQHNLERSFWVGNRKELLQTVRCVVGVDPPSGSGTCGIVVVGMDDSQHLYVLDDYSVTDATPRQWAIRAAQAAADYTAPLIAEINQGGRMVTEVLKQASPGLPIHTVNASVSKKTRAEPVALLWEAEEQTAHLAPKNQDDLAKLIDQLTGWVPGEGNSPDRLDAMVWAATWLLNKNIKAQVHFPTSNTSVKSGMSFSALRRGGFWKDLN